MGKIDFNQKHSPEAMPRLDQDLELLKARQILPRHRDTCAHLLLPLDECRCETAYNPDRCTHERHIYEECMYIAWKQRVLKKKAMKEQEKAAAAEVK